MICHFHLTCSDLIICSALVRTLRWLKTHFLSTVNRKSWLFSWKWLASENPGVCEMSFYWNVRKGKKKTEFFHHCRRCCCYCCKKKKKIITARPSPAAPLFSKTHNVEYNSISASASASANTLKQMPVFWIAWRAALLSLSTFINLSAEVCSLI